MPLPKVAIILLNWNGKEDTLECLESLKHITYLNYEILLVDNGSNDWSVMCFKEQYPGMEIIENGENLGFAEGNNVGIRRAMDKGANYILLLNNDTVVDPEFLGELVKVGEKDEKIGIMGPTVYYYSDQNRIQSAGVKLCWNTGKQNILRSNEIDDGQINEIKEVDYVGGCALLAKIELFENIGYLNSEYFAYWEETDLCRRGYKAGYKTVYVPKSKIWHKISQSAGKINGFFIYHITRNMFWFMRQHATKIQFISYLLYFFGFSFWFTSSIYVYHRNIVGLLFFLRGVKDGIVCGVKN